MAHETKFTPGPWHVGEVRHAGAFQLVTADSKGYVCEVRCGYVGNELDHEKREANARLIAAAPDLYEALAHCIAQMEIVRGKLEAAGVGNLGAGSLGRQCDVARDAMRKAGADI